ncbi:MAG: TonB-dependent receptor [Bacteroidota bacterium]|nr:TonB-dependent receptor [Bacteroidota bacterium]
MKQQNFVRKRTGAFRQWTRKPFAVFNSLTMVMKIGVLSAVYSLSNPTQTANGQGETSVIVKKDTLEEVEVTGQQAPKVNSQIARVVSVISRSEVDRAPVQSPNDLLRYLPQVDIRQRGANGVQADVSIQGGSSDQTLILLNGINFNDPQTGHYHLNLPVGLESIDRIEVLKGPASRVYGSGAFSGAINFVTGLNPNNYVKVSQTGGDFGLQRSVVAINQHSESVHNFVEVSRSQSDGYIHNTDYDIKNIYYHGKAYVKDGNIALQLGYTDKNYGANSFYGPQYLNQHESTQTYFGSLGAEVGSIVKLNPFTYWRRNYDHYILDYTNPSLYQNYHRTDAYGGGLRTAYYSALGKTSLGIEYRKEVIYSTNLGTPITDTKKIPGEDVIRYNKKDQREDWSAHLEQNIVLGRFAAAAGVMADHNSKLNGLEFYPGLDLSYQVAAPIRVYASANRSFRLPTFTDLYYVLKGATQGNPNLKPEKAWLVEGGIKLERKGIDGNLSYFHRWGTNMIDWVRYSGTTVWTSQNISKLNTDGVEVSARIKPREIIDPSFIINQISVSYSFTYVDKANADFDSNYVLDFLKHKFVASIDHGIWGNIGATWYFTWQDRNGTYGKYNVVDKTSVSTAYAPFCLFDGSVYYKTKRLKVFAQASNIFNADYIDIGNIAQPGRWFKAGVELNIGWK